MQDNFITYNFHFSLSFLSRAGSAHGKGGWPNTNPLISVFRLRHGQRDHAVQDFKSRVAITYNGVHPAVLEKRSHEFRAGLLFVNARSGLFNRREASSDRTGGLRRDRDGFALTLCHVPVPYLNPKGAPGTQSATLWNTLSACRALSGIFRLALPHAAK
jgi:hypothetical protein